MNNTVICELCKSIKLSYNHKKALHCLCKAEVCVSNFLDYVQCGSEIEVFPVSTLPAKYQI